MVGSQYLGRREAGVHGGVGRGSGDATHRRQALRLSVSVPVSSIASLLEGTARSRFLSHRNQKPTSYAILTGFPHKVPMAGNPAQPSSQYGGDILGCSWRNLWRQIYFSGEAEGVVDAKAHAGHVSWCADTAHTIRPARQPTNESGKGSSGYLLPLVEPHSVALSPNCVSLMGLH